MTQLSGLAVSRGVAIGTAYVYRPFVPVVGGGRINDTESELARYFELRGRARIRLSELAAGHAIFAAHMEMLDDIALNEAVEENIRTEYMPADAAIDAAYAMFAKILAGSKSEIIRQRVSDLEDIRLRLLRMHAGVENEGLSGLPGDRKSVV
jgi:phosphotransferase system enzyme I (PtsI)